MGSLLHFPTYTNELAGGSPLTVAVQEILVTWLLIFFIFTCERSGNCALHFVLLSLGVRG